MKKIILFLIILSMLLTTGCWDMIEVDQRIYPYSVGYDLIDPEEGMYYISISYPNLSALGKNALSEDKVHLVSTEANNIYDATHRLSSKVQYQFYLKHLKDVVLSEAVAMDEKLMRETLDGLYRDFITNKNVEMLLVKDSAEEVLNTILESKKLNAVEGALNSMLQNVQDSTMFTPKTLGKFIYDTDISGVAIIPVVALAEEEIEISGGAIFKNYKLIGYIDGMTNRDLAYLRDEADHDGFRTVYNGSDLTLMITNVKTRPILIDSSDNLKVRMDVEIEGHIHSYMIGDNRYIEAKETLESMQNQVAKEYEDNFKKTVDLIQRQYKVDALKIGDYLRKFHQKVWMNVKDNWEEIYPEIDIEMDVKVYIRRRGLTK